VSDDRTRPFSILDGEFGFRLTRLWVGWDLGLFFMTYYDRYPNYVPRVTSHSPLEVQVTTEHPRLGSLGLTGTKDFRSLLFRFESMYTRQRTYDAFQPPNYFQFQSDEVVAALELETTRYTPWRLGAQLAHTWIPHRVAGALAMPHRTLVSANLRGPLWDETTLETILSYGIQDGSSLARLRYTIPTSTQIELVLGADLLFGGRQSQFGRYHPASRAY